MTIIKKGFYTYNQTEDKFEPIVLNINAIKTVAELPTASAENVGLAVIYNDHIYICKETTPNVYDWVDVIAADFVAKSNGIITTNSMPSASESNLGYTYFYIGATTATFTTKSFYKCVETLPSTTPKTYHYEEYKFEVFVDTNNLATIANPSSQVIYRVTSGTGNYKLNDAEYNISEEHNIRAYKILNATQVQVSTTGITISGVSYSYGAITTAFQNALVNASMAGYLTWTSAYDDRNTFDSWFSNGEIDFVVTEIDYENTDVYYKDSLTLDALNYKLYHNPTETAGVDNFIEIGGNLDNYYDKTFIDTYKQDKLTPSAGSAIQDTDTISDVNLTTKNVIARTFTQVWSWITGKLTTVITNTSTNSQIPSAKAVYDLVDGKRLYQHIFGIRYAGFANFYGMFYIFSTNDTPFTYTTLAKWLYDNGFIGENAQYPLSGSDDFVNRYASSTSGGSNDKLFTATGPMIGLCSDDGTTIKYYYNRTNTRTLSSTQSSGTWIQNVNILRIL